MIIFITGASAGFGEAIARHFINHGHKVIGTARRLDKLQALHQELGDLFYPLQLDVTDKKQSVKFITNYQNNGAQLMY